MEANMICPRRHVKSGWSVEADATGALFSMLQRHDAAAPAEHGRPQRARLLQLPPWTRPLRTLPGVPGRPGRPRGQFGYINTIYNFFRRRSKKVTISTFYTLQGKYKKESWFFCSYTMNRFIVACCVLLKEKLCIYCQRLI